MKKRKNTVRQRHRPLFLHQSVWMVMAHKRSPCHGCLRPDKSPKNKFQDASSTTCFIFSDSKSYKIDLQLIKQMEIDVK